MNAGTHTIGEATRVVEAARAVATIGAADCAVALVLGSGLRSFASQLDSPRTLRFADVPHWPAPRVEGHGAELVVGTIDGVPIACLTGRVHRYEGWSATEVVRAVRTLRHAGVSRFVLTNAAGGIADGLQAGDLMRITDHLNLTGDSPLVGEHEPAFGPRFPDQSAVWDPRFGNLLASLDADLCTGVYAGLLGPSYETPAEVRMLRALGASAVGMSTVLEAIALNAMGARLAGLSLISNLAAGIAGQPLSHDEVIAAGRAAEPRFVRLLTGFCRRLGHQENTP